MSDGPGHVLHEHPPADEHAFQSSSCRFIARLLEKDILRSTEPAWKRWITPGDYQLDGVQLVAYAKEVEQEYAHPESQPIAHGEVVGLVNDVLTGWNTQGVFDVSFASVLSSYFSEANIGVLDGTKVNRYPGAVPRIQMGIMDEPKLERRLGGIMEKLGVQQPDSVIRLLARRKHTAHELGHVAYSVFFLHAANETVPQSDADPTARAKFLVDAERFYQDTLADYIYTTYSLRSESMALVSHDESMRRQTSEERIARGFEYRQLQDDLTGIGLSSDRVKGVMDQVRIDDTRHEQDVRVLKQLAKKKGIDVRTILSNTSREKDYLVRQGVSPKAAHSMLDLSATTLGYSNGLTPDQVQEWMGAMQSQLRIRG